MSAGRRVPFFPATLSVFCLALSAAVADVATPIPSPLPSAAPDASGITLAPVVAEGTPADVLKYDAILPAIQGETTNQNGNGAITHDLMNQIPLHFGDNGRAGNATQVSGYTKTAEEVDVNVLGIPLNGSQGGGFNLSSFPQYVWSGFSFQTGPSLGAYDPRATGGSLNLRLWTAEAITEDAFAYRATGSFSTEHVGQFSVGGDYGKRAAIAVGESFGDVKGPAGSASVRILGTDANLVKFHLLATDQKVTDFLSERATGSGTAVYQTLRYVPILQYDHVFGENLRLKTSWFYDYNYLKTDDSTYYANGVPYRRSRAKQGGVETALLAGKTKLGLSLRQADYQVTADSWVAPNSIARSEYAARTEQFGNAQATHTFDFSDRLTLEPTVGGTAVTRFGFYPSASVGSKYFLEKGDSRESSVFARIGTVARFPSIVDRYPTYAGVTEPNPDLKPERVYSAEIGTERTAENYRSALTAYARESWDTRDYRPYVFIPPSTIIPGQIINNGRAYAYGAFYTLDLHCSPFFTPGVRGHWEKSRFKDASKAMPYSPEWIGILNLDFHDPLNRYGAAIAARASSDFYSISENSNAYSKLPGYGYVDLTARAKLGAWLEGSAGIENIFDRPIQFRAGQPTDGRVYTVAATGVF